MGRMRRTFALMVLLPAAGFILAGCATMRYPGAYKVEGREFKEFKQLDDERALKLVALIYNVNAAAWEETIARSITLDEYIKLLAKRRSKYIMASGVFEMKYDKVDISKWEYGELAKLYDALEPRGGKYHMYSAPELSESENAARIIYLTAIGSVVKELKTREAKSAAYSIVGQVLLTALSVALAMV